MGAFSRQNTSSSVTKVSTRRSRQNSGEWDHIQSSEVLPDAQAHSPAASSSQGSAQPERIDTPTTTGDITDWETPQLPLLSLVLDHADNSIPLSFLHVYPTILRKFPGPPCEALGKTISYLQALFTMSPGFHSYITFMPSGALPADADLRNRVAEKLERNLIQTVQRLFAFFHDDVNCVTNYINHCRAELIPKPVFVVYDQSSDKLPSMSNGVEGFNNSVAGGAKIWVNEASHSIWRRHQEHEALQQNLQKCARTIARTRAPLSTPIRQPSSDAQTASQPRFAGYGGPLPHFPPPNNYPAPFALNFNAPMQTQPTLRLTPMNSPPRPPQIFHVPHVPHPSQLIQQPPVVPQPNVQPMPPRFVGQPPAPDSSRKEQSQQSSLSPKPIEADQSIKADLSRLESKVEKLAELVEQQSKISQP